ncbi:delta(3,5)-Delta(2,4)-dienoyl-CoA isomerase, mitochondrial [Parasteatoda tepidariorum]|uniref:delta(3,5)-Delta(2,4)-dienoyl-CoA isomerase, mitochondrial n=1 Tax=Parasteatoda tepidariorum TaxID=114398 RepID=UPI001C72837F|nr:delta(3,5)-Delta(2,4)-dienoyl-CoA isomerase, mitochondrial [Parasteatoda tepidariorum]
MIMVFTLAFKSFQTTTKYLLASGLKQMSINKRAMASTAIYEYETLSVTSDQDHVLHVQLNRPECLNAMNKMFWQEIRDCFKKIRNDQYCRVAIISGAGKAFSAGLDFTDMLDITSKVLSKEDIARKAKYLHSIVEQFQQSFTAVEDCQKPVIAAVHGACIGAGVNLIAACDIRYCSEDAYFSIKEIDIGIAADVGILQRLPKSVGNDSLLREYIYSCENMSSEIAKEIGIVSKVFPSRDEMFKATNHLAGIIARKSPVAVQGTKKALTYSRDHSVKEGLEFMTYWNMTMLQSEDVLKAAEATITKTEKRPHFSKL